MANFIKKVITKVYPSDAYGWDTTHSVDEPAFRRFIELSEGQSIPTISVPDDGCLYPETSYTAQVTYEDKHGNTIGPITAASVTRNDYPIFTNIHIDHREDMANGYKLSNYTKNYVSAGNNEVLADRATTSEIKEDLNKSNRFLSQNQFTAHNIIDFRDKNAFDENTITTSSFSKITENSAIYSQYYADNDSCFIPGYPNLLGLGILNKTLGIHKVNASFTFKGVTVNSSNVTFGTYNTIGEDIPVNPELISDFKPENISGQDQTISSFNQSTASSSNFDVYYQAETITTSEPAVWLGIFTKDWEESNTDENGLITVTAYSHGKNQNNLSTSTLSIPFKTFAPPQINVLDSSDNEVIGVASVNSYTAIDFGGSLPEHYKIIAKTDQTRPFLPLINVGNDSGSGHDIIDTTIHKFYKYDITTFPAGTEKIEYPNRQTPFVIEAFVYEKNGDTNDNYLIPCPDTNTTEVTAPAASGYTPKWKAIGATPTSVNNELTIVREYLNNDGIISANILNTTAGTYLDANNKLNLLWPSNPARISYKGDTNISALEKLVPGKYYKFRAVAANFCGTRVNEFIFKTLDPTPCTMTSYVGSNSTPGSTININPDTPLNIGAAFTLGGGHDIRNTKPTITVSINNTDVPDSTQTSTEYGPRSYMFGSQGTYNVVIQSPTFGILNSDEEPLITHNYTIIVTAAPNTTVVTNNAANITTNSVELSGSVSHAGGRESNTQGFILSTTQSDITQYTTPGESSSIASGLSAWTQSQQITTTGNFSTTKTGLSANTTYYYAAYVIDNDSPNSYKFGECKSFQTDNLIPTPNIDITNLTRTTLQIQIS